MKTISEVVMFTNGVFMVFDEQGQQHYKAQECLLSHYMHVQEETLEQMLVDKPKISISKWSIWIQTLTMAEFCYLTGHGNWYEKKLREIPVEN